MRKTPKIDILIRYVSLAEELAEANDGHIPSVTWLRRNGYNNLYQYMRAHPKKFKHLEQEVRGVRGCDENIKKRQVDLAKKLAAQNNGILRSGAKLIESGYSDLVSYMRRHPEFFTNILQKKDKTTPEEHVKTAEKYASDNNGTFPGPWSIIETNGWALYACMKRHPHLFSHIPGVSKKVMHTVSAKNAG